MHFNNKVLNYQNSRIYWKDTDNTKNIIVAKNVKNNITLNDKNCVSGGNCFKANPIKHYRKQLISLDNKKSSYSNHNYVNNLDKPGNYIITNKNNLCLDNSFVLQNGYIHFINDLDIYPNPNDKFYDNSNNRIICTACNPQSLVLKSANTNLDKKYSSSNREYLYRKNKTYNQNLPLKKSSTENYYLYTRCSYLYNNETICNTFNPSNKKYKVQGPITSSSRTTALKYSYVLAEKKSVNKDCTNVCQQVLNKNRGRSNNQCKYYNKKCIDF